MFIYGVRTVQWCWHHHFVDDLTVIGGFPRHELDRIIGKVIKQKFMSTYSLYWKMGHEPDRITGKLIQNKAFSWEMFIIHIWISFSAHGLIIHKNWEDTNEIRKMSFPVKGLALNPRIGIFEKLDELLFWDVAVNKIGHQPNCCIPCVDYDK